ncbi:MAG TPA: cytochrome P460 family protein [Phycisphaerales bacterium]|nr:cytochrome P460 family protein [Phycisphaerales bacterium]
MKIIGALGLGAMAALAVAGCVSGSKDAKGEKTKEVVTSETERRLLEAGAEYRQWDRVSDRAHWAPEMCLALPKTDSQLSESADSSTHGGKLYYLFAKYGGTYDREIGGRPQVPQQAGQVIVKQSWTPKEVPPERGSSEQSRSIRERHSLAFAERDGKYWEPGEAKELFVMLKNDPPFYSTDGGWTYAVLTPDGGRVLRAGMLRDCMGCHEKAPFDSLFGSVTARASKELR